MSSLFNSIKIKITRPVTQIINRKPVTGKEVIAEHVPCRITGTWDGSTRLFIHKKYVDKYLPEGLHSGYIIEVENPTNGTHLQQYTVSEEPIWAGGVEHHFEVSLNLEV